MLSRLRNHPFPVEAHFRHSFVLAYAVPRQELAGRIPECLELDLFEGEWAFLAVAMVSTDVLRPKGFPKVLGRNFVLVGYRIFVRYKSETGRTLRGLYILRSETDSRAMELLGGLFTRYRYFTTDIEFRREGDKTAVSSGKTGLNVQIRTDDDAPLPLGSPFADWREARRFSGPLPFTFSFEEAARRVLVVEGVRSSWTPRPVRVERAKIPFVDSLALEGSVLANAFIVSDVPYHWKRGRTEQWTR